MCLPLYYFALFSINVLIFQKPRWPLFIELCSKDSPIIWRALRVINPVSPSSPQLIAINSNKFSPSLALMWPICRGGRRAWRWTWISIWCLHTSKSTLSCIVLRHGCLQTTPTHMPGAFGCDSTSSSTVCWLLCLVCWITACAFWTI